MKEFIKTTILGGIVFLLPAALIVAVLSHAMRIAVKVAQPISHEFELDKIGKVAGIGIVTLVAVLLLIVVSFGAGVVARTSVGKRISGWFEKSLLGGMPQYQMVKSMAEGLTQIESAQLKPVLVSVDDGAWQLGYSLEQLDAGHLAVFMPQAPTPMSGNVMYYPADRVRPLDITMLQATSLVKHIGVGSGEVLRGVKLA
ncbi:putative membrane protein [Bradyrhizobium japonicum USDA 38]|uniref:DUF502 domain-containing protein n=1 Tax=Bradyrhizobium japonicum TaxID=375 RepID=UPI0003FCEBE5|nr:DUF502 domain-containing protein [Bradyrhizobium japonicum]MCS3892895.1 putative membrane protein [Bradyrhizobium japonicum USDA 38]MCS3945408.1 putative membrane protein [Bradyrhizobium japonicum]MCW2222067.1 putative membrane protein [Bradyrhizobium japonicum]MCW2346679.1 putative membrane protein [Bradyrhizobium japonicum]